MANNINGRVYTVSEINMYVKHIIDNDMFLNHFYIKGEIFNYKPHISGHEYFTLKDATTRIKAVMFKANASKLKFKLEEGMSVVLQATCTTYERDGQYQLRVIDIIPDGVGPLYVAYEQLKKKLEAKGYFDIENKKALPNMPQKIGIVTSIDGAAIKDMVSVISRRFPIVEINIYAAQVQGVQAVSSIVAGIEYFNKTEDIDLIIIGRGGGSIEELWAFNEEAVADAIYKSQIPIISAVGHETDYTISDMVADKRAATPSVAGEICIPNIIEIQNKIDGMREWLLDNISSKIKQNESLIENYQTRIEKYNFIEVLNRKNEDIDNKIIAMDNAIDNMLTIKENKLQELIHKIDILSPIASLKRGYAITRKSGTIIKSKDELNVKDKISINYYDGEVIAEIVELTSESFSK